MTARILMVTTELGMAWLWTNCLDWGLGLFFFVCNQCFISIFLKNCILTILLGLSSMFLQPKSDQTGCSAHGKIYLGTYKYSMW